MTTGLHLVSDIFCVSCCSCVGWRYVSTVHPLQHGRCGQGVPLAMHPSSACFHTYTRNIHPIVLPPLSRDRTLLLRNHRSTKRTRYCMSVHLLLLRPSVLFSTVG